MSWWMAAVLWACIVLVGASLVGWMADAGLRDVIDIGTASDATRNAVQSLSSVCHGCPVSQ